ncbi:leucine-rich repeat extensin-like protein 5 [Sinocyclocheilus rhinocerous]|uniref:leucine-rich repeat extensin-like protein 5 n=1 Tax=Sinocyclocheilus rhinocerous TaxID=307959 RepID=UPI0007B7B447|nr:PREDICTED: leucine-rich repeat extensin-like protein 5 [Sinocyclocheilus rhinocerous]
MWRVSSSSPTGSDMEVEEVMRLPKPRHPTPAGMRRVSPAHPTPRTSTYHSNGSYRLPNPKFPVVLRSSAGVFSPGAPCSQQSRWPSARKSSPPDVHVALAPVPTPQKRFAGPAPPECPPVPAPHKHYLDPQFSPVRAPVLPLSPGQAPHPHSAREGLQPQSSLHAAPGVLGTRPHPRSRSNTLL